MTCWMPDPCSFIFLSYIFQMIKKNVHKYSLKQEASRKKIEEEERKAQEYGAYLQYSIPVYNSPSSHGTKKMEKPPGKCFSGKYISLS